MYYLFNNGYNSKKNAPKTLLHNSSQKTLTFIKIEFSENWNLTLKPQFSAADVDVSALVVL